MAVDLRDAGAAHRPEGHGQLRAERPWSRRWALEQDRDAVRVVLWGEMGRRETVAIDLRIQSLRVRSVPFIIDLTGVTELHESTVVWLGLRHEEFGRERPLVVCVVADGHVHRRLTRPDAPKLRLTLE